jgi:hypothetical protein
MVRNQPIYIIRSNGNWTQQAKIEASDKASGDNFGLGVAISGDGNTVIVGAPREDPGDPAVTNAGSAYIFTHANGNWTQQAKINASDNVYIGSFGARVAISGDGNTAIVGAIHHERVPPEGAHLIEGSLDALYLRFETPIRKCGDITSC